MAVRDKTDHLFYWGSGIRAEKVRKPSYLFSTHKGIKNLKAGWRHILFTDEFSNNLYSWGDNTYGQTGNESLGEALLKKMEMHKNKSEAY